MMDLETYFAYKATDTAVGMAIFVAIFGMTLVFGLLRIIAGVWKERQRRRTRKLLGIEGEKE